MTRPGRLAECIDLPLHAPFTLWTSLSPAEVLDRVMPGVRGLPCHATDDGFGLHDALSATLFPDEQGTTVEGSVAATEARALIAHLATLLDAEADLREEVADPTADGAESAAPASLRAALQPDGVRFVVTGPVVFGAWGPSSTSTGLVVRATGLEIEGRVASKTWPWGRVAGCAIMEHAGHGHLVLLDEAGAVVAGIPCAGSADDEWLAAYIDARARARNPAPEDRAATHRERAKLGSLLGAARRKP